MSRLSILFALFCLVNDDVARAAPCCASNSAAPSLIAGDDQAQLTLLGTRSNIIGDAFEYGIPVFRAANDSETTQTYSLEGALLLSDRFQASVGIPLVQHEVSRPALENRATRLGDVRASVAYEYLPEWTYSPWKPKGLGFIQLTVPTGRSIHDAQAEGLVDATGRGFFSFELGTLLTKKWGAWDAYAIPEVHYSLDRTFDDTTTSETLAISPGWGTSLALGAGVSPGEGRLRLGLRIQPILNQGRIVSSTVGTTESSSQQSCTIAVEGSYLAHEDWTVFAAYSDQTLIGPARNATLSRALALGVQHRWQR